MFCVDHFGDNDGEIDAGPRIAGDVEVGVVVGVRGSANGDHAEASEGTRTRERFSAHHCVEKRNQERRERSEGNEGFHRGVLQHFAVGEDGKIENDVNRRHLEHPRLLERLNFEHVELSEDEDEDGCR